MVFLFAGLVAVQTTQAPPAKADILACGPHTTIAAHTTAGGNVYDLEVHLCLDYEPTPGSPGYSTANTRAHWHCERNNVAWDGCRVNAELVVEKLNAPGWQDIGSTAFSITEPNSGYFANSQTRVSFRSGIITCGPPCPQIRAKVEDPDNMRFLLADGTSVLKDTADAAGPAYQT